MKKNNIGWAYKTFVLSISLSIVFSILSQSLFPKLSNFLSMFVIFFFVFVSVVFDMISVGVTSLDVQKLEKYFGQTGYETAKKLCQHTEKVSSFCGDVVGDICGILSGAGGVSLVLNMNIQDPTIDFLVTCVVSSLIAGITIFGKAIMKNYSVENCDVVVMKTGKIIESMSISRKKRSKSKDKCLKFKKNKKK